jgi:nitrogen fixation NifU-like protein
MPDIDPLYQEIILDLYRHPHNRGILEFPDADGEDNNPFCGDSIRLTLKITDDIITDIAHSGQGCAISQAAVSLLTDAVKNKSIAEVKKFTEKNMTDLLGIPISHTRIKCATLGLQVLKKII